MLSYLPFTKIAGISPLDVSSALIDTSAIGYDYLTGKKKKKQLDTKRLLEILSADLRSEETLNNQKRQKQLFNRHLKKYGNTYTDNTVPSCILKLADRVITEDDLEKKDKKDVSASIQKKLRDGDVLLQRNGGTGLQNLISGVSGSPYVHAAIYADGNVYDMLANNGRGPAGAWQGNIDDLVKRDSGYTYDVYRPNNKTMITDVVKNLSNLMSETKGYSFSKAVSAGFLDRLGFNLPFMNDKSNRICSELVYDAFDGKLAPDAASNKVVSPGWLSKSPNLTPKFSLSFDYDEETGKKKYRFKRIK
jgi:hypothetical protein